MDLLSTWTESLLVDIGSPIFLLFNFAICGIVNTLNVINKSWSFLIKIISKTSPLSTNISTCFPLFLFFSCNYETNSCKLTFLPITLIWCNSFHFIKPSNIHIYLTFTMQIFIGIKIWEVTIVFGDKPIYFLNLNFFKLPCLVS